MQLTTSISDYILREPFVESMRRKRGLRWIGIPVEVISFLSPKSENYPEIFTEPLLKLIRTGVNSVGELAEQTGLAKDLVLYILTHELVEQVRVIGGHVELDGDVHRPMASLRVREMREYYLFQLPATGKLLPRSVLHDEPLWRDVAFMKDQRYPIFQFGSKGNPYPVNPFIFPQVAPAVNRLSEELVRESLAEYQVDYSAAIDFHGKDKVKETASRKVRRIRTVDSIQRKHSAYLITALIQDESGKDGWSCADPFGVFLERGLDDLNAEINSICEKSPTVKNYTDSVRSSFEDKKVDTSRYQEAEGKVLERFSGVSSGPLRILLAKLIYEYEGLETSESERLDAEGIVSLIRKLMENILDDLGSSVCMENIRLFAGDKLPDSDRKEFLLVVLDDLGSPDDVNGISNILKKPFNWKDALEGKLQFQPLLLSALISAGEQIEHPLRTAIHRNPSIIWEMRTLSREAGGMGAHFTGKGGPLTREEKEELDARVEHALKIVETFFNE